MINSQFGLIVHLIIISIYISAILYYFRIRDKINKIRLQISPCFIVGIFLILSYAILHLLEILFPVLKNSVGFLQGSQMLIILAGIFFFNGLRKLYNLEVQG